MYSSSNAEKNIVLRSRNVVVIKKLDFSEKCMILTDLFANHNPSTNNCFKKIFDFFILECVDEPRFRKNQKFLEAVKNKLNEAALVDKYGWELTNNYMRAIFPRSARIEYLLLRSKKNEIQSIKKRKIRQNRSEDHSDDYVRWVCLQSPARSFRNVMDFIGPSYYSS